jgi:hypothetical protein
MSEGSVRFRPIAKEDLCDGAYYFGDCRNSNVARWNGVTGRFYYQRHKFGAWYCESLPPREDDAGWDFFTPYEEIILEGKVVTDKDMETAVEGG